MEYKNVRRKVSAGLFAGALVLVSVSTPLFAKSKIDANGRKVEANNGLPVVYDETANVVLKEDGNGKEAARKELAAKILNADKVEKAKYTKASYDALAAVVAESKVVQDDQKQEEAAVRAAMTKLDKAMAELVLAPADQQPLDKDNLKNGTYEVGVNLWNADEDKPSMADSTFVKTATVVVKDGVYTMYIKTQPMTVGTITASLQELKVKVNGAFEQAKVESTQNGNPTSFSFVLPTKDMYIDVLVNPKVAVMGNTDVAARIKVNYDTLKKVSDSVDKPSLNTQQNATTDSVIKMTGAQTSNYVGVLALLVVSFAAGLVYKTRRKFLIK